MLMYLSFCPFCMLCFQHSVQSFAFLLENGRNQVSLAVFVVGFCVNLQKEVTAGCLASWDNAQWESSTLEYESLQLSRVFILGLIRSHPSPPSSPSVFFFPVSLIPLLHSLLFTRTFHLTLLRSRHPITLFPSFSLSFCNFPPWWDWWGREAGSMFHSLAVCSYFFFRSFVYPFIQKSLVKFFTKIGD